MCRVALFCLLVLGLGPAQAHHGSALYYDMDDIATIEGRVRSISWRNPHVTMELERTVEGGGSEMWEIETASANGLQRVGIEQGVVSVGERVALTGARSRHGLPAMAAFVMTLEDGTDVPVWPQRVRRMGREVKTAPIAGTVAEASRREARGIFRVWSHPGLEGQLLQDGYLPFTPAALAEQQAWDPLVDDPVLQCVPRGMPSIMNNPHPIEFIDRGDSMVLRLEEWDATRTIHLTSAAVADGEPASRYGYSVGRWEGNTLVVTTTRISDPFFDDRGTPQGESAEIVERFTLSEDESRLDYASIHTDPLTFTEPARQNGYWEWVPGEEVKSFDCLPR